MTQQQADAQVAAWDVPAPAITQHLYGQLTGARSEATFAVVNATQPVAVTAIANGTGITGISGRLAPLVGPASGELEAWDCTDSHRTNSSSPR